MRMPLLKYSALFIAIALLFSCKKKDAAFDSTDLQEQRLIELTIPLQSGRYITYRVDSMVFTSFGRNTEIHSYLVKHVVDTTVTDNLGRQGYRIFTYITDTTGTQPWQPNGSYFLIILDDHVETIEDNLRVIRIHTPVRDGNQWKGNSYLPDDPYEEFYNFSNDDDMGDWNFFFDGPLQPSVSVQDQTYNNVYTVTEDDEENPPTSAADYGSVNIAREMYSQNVGLVFRELTMWEQQPNPSGNPPNVTYDPYKIGFGMKMWMVDHN